METMKEEDSISMLFGIIRGKIGLKCITNRFYIPRIQEFEKLSVSEVVERIDCVINVSRKGAIISPILQSDIHWLDERLEQFPKKQRHRKRNDYSRNFLSIL